MKPVSTYFDSSKEINDMILLEHQDIKICLESLSFPIGLKKFLWLKKLKILCHVHVINNLNGEEIVQKFLEKEFQKTKQKE